MTPQSNPASLRTAKSTRLDPQAGIAIGVILFIVAILGVIAIAMSSGSNTAGSTVVADRTRTDLKTQGNLIRSKLLECNQYSQERGDLADKYPASSGSGILVSNIDCMAYTTSSTPDTLSNLWTGAHAANFPKTPTGFEDWYYVNAGDAGGRCIRIQPLSGTVNDAGIRAGIAEAVTAFSSQEVVYNAGGATQRFILWITYPTGSASSNCQ